MNRHLHIICFSVPWPVDYGGAFDLFYKLPALKALGAHIHLHCFDYGRGRQPVLEQYCASVQYYERLMGHTSIRNRLPYIVSSRRNEILLQNLLQDDYPILMEGIHCTWLLNDDRFRNRKCFVRLHNVEYKYYRELSSHTPLSFKKLYYLVESRLLRAYEKRIARKAVFFAVTEQDADTYRNEMGCTNISYLPVFLPAWEVSRPEGIGSYCLYHGDLSIDANEKAAIWLLTQVFNKIPVPFIIAGKHPSRQLASFINKYPHAQLMPNPPDEQMQELISGAQVHVLPSYTATGIKLKLLNVLFHGRHCIVSPATAEGSGLEAACHIAATANAYRELVAQLYHMPFTEEEIILRKQLLTGRFDHARNAEVLVKKIWS